MRKRFYKAPDGQTYPLMESPWDMTFRVYKSDKRRAVRNDPHSCLIALGIRRHPDVKDAFIGSGKDAYVIFKGHRGESGIRGKDHAVHLTIPAASGRVRDSFDTKGSPTTQEIKLRAPTAARTLDARHAQNKARRAAIKAGSPVRKRGKPRTPRVVRLGVVNRPRADISGSTLTLRAMKAKPDKAAG